MKHLKPPFEGWTQSDQPDTDPLAIFLPIGYDGEIVDDFRNVMRIIDEHHLIFYDKIAAALDLPLKYVHLTLEVLADRGILEYGVSPRGGWLSSAGEELLVMANEWRSQHVDR